MKTAFAPLLVTVFFSACGVPEPIAPLTPDPATVVEPKASLAWLTVAPETLHIDHDQAALFAFHYKVDLADPAAGGALYINHCAAPAGETEHCFREDLALLNIDDGHTKAEVDPSVYHVGHNSYRLVLTFERDAEKEAAELAFDAEVTACTSCRTGE